MPPFEHGLIQKVKKIRQKGQHQIHPDLMWRINDVVKLQHDACNS